MNAAYENAVISELEKIAYGDGYGYDKAQQQMQPQQQPSHTARNIAIGAGIAGIGAGALLHKGFGDAAKKIGGMIKGNAGQEAGQAVTKPAEQAAAAMGKKAPAQFAENNMPILGKEPSAHQSSKAYKSMSNPKSYGNVAIEPGTKSGIPEGYAASPKSRQAMMDAQKQVRPASQGSQAAPAAAQPSQNAPAATSKQEHPVSAAIRAMRPQAQPMSGQQQQMGAMRSINTGGASNGHWAASWGK